MAEKKGDGCVHYYATPEHLAPGPTPTSPPTQPPRFSLSLIDEFTDEYWMDFLITKVLENLYVDEFLRKARHLLELLDSGPLMSESDAYKISLAVLEVWQDPCFYEAVCATMKEVPITLPELLKFANDHLPFQRLTDMKSDDYFTTMMHSVTDGRTPTTIRACLCIVIGHWIHEAQLSQLDKGLGSNYFERSIAFRRACKMAPKDKEFKMPEISYLDYVLESASRVGDMRPLRKQLVNKYGEGHENIEAMLDKAKSDLIRCVGIHQKYLGYDGGKAKIRIVLANDRILEVTITSALVNF